MSFEKRVLNVVRSTVTGRATFINGSLFVKCSVSDAVTLESALLKALKCGIIISRIGSDETAYDFV